MANDDSENENLAKNLFIIIWVIMLIIMVLPSFAYAIATGSRRGIQNDKLIQKYEIDSKDHDKYNTFDEIYLFCSYILFRRVKICDDADVQETVRYNKHLSEVYKVMNILNELSDKSREAAEKNKKDSLDAILREKEKRELREHEEQIASRKDAGENSRFEKNNFRLWFLIGIAYFGTFINKFAILFDRLSDKILQIINIFTPIIRALASNRVFVGFVILVIFIAIIFGLLKPKDEEKKKKENNLNSPDVGGMSAIYKEIIDTYNYYRNMIRNFRLSDMSGGLLKNEEENIDDNDKFGLIKNRKTVDGKLYDNLSYIMLSEVFNDNEIASYFGKGVKIDRGKYYNIYLPNEKFKENMSSIKWKISDAAKRNEKVWRIDCEQIATLQKNDNGIYTDTKVPAFIKEKDKCVINVSGLDKINKPQVDLDAEEIPYKTEYIR